MVKFTVDYLNVQDADAIVLSYQKDEYSDRVIVLIDAGNVGDEVIIKDHLKKRYDTTIIDYAVCTHPDKDHKGGFFGLFADPQVTIKNFIIKDPWNYVDKTTFARNMTKEQAIKKARMIFNHPTDTSRNLIDIAIANCKTWNVNDGNLFIGIPLSVVGPSEDYYEQVVLEMIESFVEVKDDADFEEYDEKASVSESDAKSVIDEAEDDPSATNKSSIMLLFEPVKGLKYLFLGDATCASITDAISNHPEMVECFIKVPHHGSKHNMTTKLIDKLKPRQSIISAKGTIKHPNKGLVYWLSKYGNVYSTHKLGVTCTFHPKLSPI